MKTSTELTPVSTIQLKSIATDPGPCVTILMPVEAWLSAQNRNENRLQKAMRAAKQTLIERDYSQADSLLSGMDTTLADFVPQRGLSGLAILRSPSTSLHFPVSNGLDESVHVGEHFFVRPLLPLRDRHRAFFILALSQKKVRLLHSTEFDSMEVPLPPSVPKNLEEDMQTKPPDHRLEGRSTAGPSTGAMKGVSFGMLSDREAKNEYLSHFFRAIDRGVREVLRNERAPLVLAGVDYEVALYRKVNTYPHLGEEAVIGAPAEINGELHAKALNAVRKVFDAPVKEALDAFEQLEGTPRTLTSLKETVKAASEGRVSHLFVAADAEQPGVLIEETGKVRAHREAEPGDEDLINLAAIHALRTSSEIFTLPRNRMPHGAQLAAILRF